MSNHIAPPARQESNLKRNLTFIDLMGIAIGQIIGAGIMSSTGIAIGMTGTGVVLAFMLSPILTIITIFPLAILGSAVPTTGGAYRYVSRNLGKGPGLAYLLLHVSSNIAIAQYALSFAAYLVSITTGLNERFVAIAVLTFFFVVQLIGTRTAAVVGKVMAICLIGGLTLFIGFGFGKADLSYVFAPEHLFMNGPFAFVSTLALLSSATGGAQCIAELGGEAKNAGKTIPLTIILSTLFVGIFYVLIAIVASGVLPVAQVMDQPLTLVARETMPTAAFYMFIIGAALGATATTLNSSLATITKPLLVACDDGVLPKSLNKVSRFGVPYKLLTAYYIIGMFPLLTGFNLATITKFTTANSLLYKILICLACFFLARKHKDVLAKSSMRISSMAAQISSVVAIVFLLILSYSLFANLKYYAIVFALALVVFAFIYSRTAIRDISLDYDLEIDYTSKKEEL